MHRFSKKKKSRITSTQISILLLGAILAIFLYGIYYIGSSTSKHQEDSLVNALERNIVHCYALEGFYPPSLAYMEEHYGLTYDKNKFMVDYRPIASNLYPDFTVIVKGDSK